MLLAIAITMTDTSEAIVNKYADDQLKLLPGREANNENSI